MTYNNLQGTFTTMIGFVTWPPYTSWPYLISEFLIAYIIIVASDWPCTFFTPKVFLFSISLLFVGEENIMKKLLEKLLKITILTTT